MNGSVTHASNTGTDNSNNAVIECLCVNRNWLSSTAALLYRTVDVSQSAVNITKLTSTLLDPNALLPYSMLVKSIKCIPPFHPDQEAGSLEDEAAIPDIHLSPLTNSIEQINHNQLYQEADAWIEMGDLDTLLQLCPLVTSFTWIASPMASNILVQSLADNTHRLTSLSLRECPVTDLLIQTLCISTRKLVHIDLSYTLVSIASAITILDHCTHISKLILEGVSASLHPVPFSPLDNPSKTRPLKFLNLRNSGVSDVHLRAMAVRAPHLVHARLEGCASLTDDAVVALSRTCERLEVLDLSLVSLVSDLSLYALIHNTSTTLRNLSLSGCPRVSVAAIQLLIDTTCAPGSRNPLQHLALHGCPAVLGSYLAQYDLQRSEALECMLDAAELRAAVGARERMGSPGGASSVGTKVDEYAMDTSELWMLAAYNTRVLDGGNAQGVDALTDDGSLSNRTSVASSGTITGVEGATVAAKLGALVEKEKKKADAAAGKRDSVNSAVSSIPSSTGSAATRVSKLPGLAGSKLPASRLRESTTVKTSGLPKPAWPHPKPLPKSTLMPRRRNPRLWHGQRARP
ncbi:hypothetical protein BC830DRAFT_503450 [Chytriomyces sp. MP71]|nr:hypothetical protein BC830DRAFT_503450 [Chytriomyces sp. MP71]